MRSLPAAPPAGGPTFRASSSRGERCVQTGWYGFAKDVSEPLLVASERVRRANPERSAYDLYGDPGTLSTGPAVRGGIVPRMRSLPAAPPAGGPTFRASSSRGERCVQTGWYGFAKDVSEPPLVASERLRRVNPERSAYDLYGDPGTLSIRTAPYLSSARGLVTRLLPPSQDLARTWCCFFLPEKSPLALVV